MRGGPAVALVLALVMPATLASAAPLPGSPACVHLDVSYDDPASGERTRREGVYPPGALCAAEPVASSWNVSPVEVSGEVALHVGGSLGDPSACAEEMGLPVMADHAWRAFRMAGSSCPVHVQSWDAPRLVDPVSWRTLQRWARGWIGLDAPPAAPAGPARFDSPASVNGSLRLSARFHVAWGVSDCSKTRGDLEVSVNGKPTLPEAPPGFFESMCRLARGAGPTLGPAGTALVLDAVSRGVPALAPRLDPMVAALAPPLESASATGEAFVAPAEGRAEASVSVETEGLLDEPSAAEPTPAGLPEERASRSDPLVRESPAPLPVPLPIPRPRAAPLAQPPAPGPAPSAPGPAAVPVVHVQAAGTHAEDALLPQAAAWTLLAFAALALYQRLRQPAALDHPARAALHAACARSATARELADVTGLGRATAEYHLVYLARLGLLRSRRDADGRRRFSPAGPRVEDAPPLARRVLDVVRARGEASLPAITDALSVTRTRADRCVKDLLLEGMLASRWKDGARLYFLP